jgi:alpha-tubulin suppressor-like RCC1 family protein
MRRYGALLLATVFGCAREPLALVTDASVDATDVPDATDVTPEVSRADVTREFRDDLPPAACELTALDGGASASHVTQITLGRDHGCALFDDGRARCWGANESGQLGDGTTVDRVSPTLVTGLTDAVELRAGGAHTCARTRDGALRCWGANDRGQLADGTLIARTTPVTVMTVTTARQIATGGAHTCALLTDGSVRCWGDNSAGQLGVGSLEDHAPPRPVTLPRAASQLSLGALHTCVLLDDGAVRCWGLGVFGQLGDCGGLDRAVPSAVAGAMGATALAAGGRHTCARMGDGTVRCWGDDRFGQAGQRARSGCMGGTGPSTSQFEPAAVRGLTDVVDVAAGGFHACARTRAERLLCWGADLYAQLGDCGASDRASPVELNLDGVREVSLGERHTCARARDAVWCWGANDRGQLGDGRVTARGTPRPVGFTETP